MAVAVVEALADIMVPVVRFAFELVLEGVLEFLFDVKGRGRKLRVLLLLSLSGIVAYFGGAYLIELWAILSSESRVGVYAAVFFLTLILFYGVIGMFSPSETTSERRQNRKARRRK
ncbi:MAG: hypothetical protein HWE08_09325 [Alphaproteobacteria bacterium]|nr:hypothetical protein [Alphaproteobacteria bacterium]